MKYWLRETENYGLRVVENGAKRMTAGVSQDSYATVASPQVFVYADQRQTTRKDCFLFTNDCKSRENAKDRSVEKNIYWCGARGQRALCTAGSSHPLQSQIRAYSGYAPQAEPLFKTKTGYYDILEVAPSATHAQIKTAYYKQSFLYHPDRNAGCEAATDRFSEISEAYAVLGNKTLRKKYDRGLLSLSDLVGAGGPSGSDPAGSGAQQRPQSRRSVMAADGREKIDNFDTFLKSHYQEQLRREKEMRLMKREFHKRQNETFEDKDMDWLFDILRHVIIITILIITFSSVDKME